MQFSAIMQFSVTCRRVSLFLNPALASSYSLSWQLRSFSATAHHGEAVKPFSAIPGPRPLPLLGNARQMGANRNRLRLYLDEGFKTYGEIFKLNFFGSNAVIIKDPDALEYVIRAEGAYPMRDNMFTEKFAWLFRNRAKQQPTFALESGERWKRLRVAAGKQATPRNVQTYSSGFNDIFQRFMTYIQSVRGEDGVIRDMSLPIKLLFVEISSLFVFGNEKRAVTDVSDEDKEFIEAVSTSIELFSRLLTELPLFKLYNNKLSRDFTRSLEVTTKVARKEMEKLYSRLDAGVVSEAPGLLEQWLREGKMSEEEAINESVGMFGAGVDTTANQSVFFLHALAKYPEVQEELYKELKSVLGESKQATPQQLSQMPYLKGCMLESFRLWSTFSAFARLTEEDSKLIGYEVPANTLVIYSLYSAGRDENLFPDPLKFDPERWERDERHAFAIQPFGFGPRACYGRRFAELEMKLLLIQVVCNFKVNTSKWDLELVEKTDLKPDGDVPIKFVDRNS